MYLPPNSIIASGPVIIEEIDGKLCTLLNKHLPTAEKPNPKWQFCGGEYEDFDHYFEETAKREAKEEMGIEIEIEKLINIILHKRENGGIAILIHYLAKRIGEITPGDEIEDWGWFPVDELPDDVADNVKPILDKVK